MGSIFFLIVLLYFVIQIPAVQTWIAQRVAGYMSDKLETRVEIKGVNIQFFDTVILEGLYIEDKHQDTLLFTNKLFVGISSLSINDSKVKLSEIKLLGNNAELKKYPGENGLNFQFIIDAFKSDKKSTTPSKPFSLTCDKFTMVNNKFSYQIVGKKPPEWGFDPANIVANRLSGEFKNLILHGDTVEADIFALTATEKSGLLLKSMKSKFTFSSHEMTFDKLNLESNASKINGKVQFGFNNLGAFAYLFDSVRVNFDLVKSQLQLADIAYFAPTLRGVNLKADIEGTFTGRLGKLKGKGVKILYGKDTKFFGDVMVKGLPNAPETFLDANIMGLQTSARDLVTIQIPPYNQKKYIEIPPEVYALGKVTFVGYYTGFFTDFVANGRFNTALGTATTDIQLSTIPGQKDLAYSGKVATENFKLGDMLPGLGLGIVTLNANVNGKGFDLKGIDTQLDGHVAAFDYNGYRYQNIDFDGTLIKTEFTGGINSKDPNMLLAFDGTMNFSKDIPVYNFDADVARIDLTALNFYTDTNNLVLSAKITSNITGNTIETLNGNIEATDVQMAYGDTAYNIGNIDVYSDVASSPKQLRLVSDIADVNIIGNYHLQSLPQNILRTVNAFLPSYLVSANKAVPKAKQKKGKKEVVPLQDFRFTATIKNTAPLTDVFLPILSVDSGGTLQGSYQSASDNIVLTGTIPSVKLSRIPMNGINITADSRGNRLNLNVTLDRMEPTDSLFLDNVFVNTSTRNDSVYADITFENVNADSSINKGDITATAKFFDKDKIRINLSKANFDAFNYQWKVNPDNLITFDKNKLEVNKLVFDNGSESFRAFGRVSTNPDDQLNLVFTKFNMSGIDRFIPDNVVKVKGTLDGSVSLSNLFDKPFFRSNLKLKDLYINDVWLGNGNVQSEWDRDKHQINVHSLLTRNDTVKTIAIDGHFYPERKTNYLDFDIFLNKIYINAINPYTKGTLTASRGDVTATLKLTGDAKNPELTGDITLRKALVTIDYLGTTYNQDKSITFKLEKDKIEIKDFVLNDSENARNNATINGAVTHSKFKNWGYNLNIQAKNFLCLNTTEAQNSLYFGKAYVTGLIKISGNIENTLIKASVKTNKGTSFNIPLSNPSEASSSDFITFVEKNPKSLMVSRPKTGTTGIILDMDLEVTPDAVVKIIFDQKVGDVITGSGRGDLKMKINTRGSFTMSGTFTIEEGEYLFTLENVINKKFKVEKGGTIVWTGSPYNAQVDITAVYDVKASLKPIMVPYVGSTEELEQYKRKVSVQCMLIMKKNLLAPDLSFAINTTTNDDKARTAIASIQNNQEELNKQIFALLILGAFLPPSQSGVGANYAAGAGNTGFELLSSQLSRWISQISDDFDININYRPGENGGPQQIDVNASTSILKDRVTIDVNVGNNGAAQSSTTPGAPTSPTAASSIVSDFNLEVKLSQDGRLRFKAFNRSNQNNIITNDVPYTQGVGLSYRREFNSFRDLFKRKNKQQAPPTNAPVTPPPVAIPPTPADSSKTKP